MRATTSPAGRTTGGPRGARPAAVALTALLPVLAGCSYATAAPETVAPTPDYPKQCGGPLPEGVGEAGYPAPDGTYLYALTVGRADAAHRVVLVHGRTQNACDWMQLARRLADRADAYVIVPDRRGVGQNEDAPTDGSQSVQVSDVVAAADAVTRLLTVPAPATTSTATATGSATTAGAAADRGRPVTVIGSSAGAPIALAAAVTPATGAPAPCSVALVSPASVPDVDPAAFRALTSPLFVTWEDDNDGIAATAQEILALAPAAAANGAAVEVAGTRDHSSGLVEKHPKAFDTLVDAVRACR